MVVVDSSALIPLARIGKLFLIPEIYGKTFTTKHVFRETVEEGEGRLGTAEIKNAFDKWIKVIEIEKEKAQKIAELEGIETADAAVILLAGEKGEILLANDKGLIELGRARGVTCHWVTTLLLNGVKKGKINKGAGKEILYKLVEQGMNLKSNVYARLLKKIDAL